ncbi:MAG: hypothetical protein BWY17_04868 [Deltaproteobacteria bacterium ADurb.Bin207]|nr:MAG: hypothetical protein BWY17_04868 [Deltaproteobacteria bacterium ADurb.Bin207]
MRLLQQTRSFISFFWVETQPTPEDAGRKSARQRSASTWQVNENTRVSPNIVAGEARGRRDKKNASSSARSSTSTDPRSTLRRGKSESIRYPPKGRAYFDTWKAVSPQELAQSLVVTPFRALPLYEGKLLTMVTFTSPPLSCAMTPAWIPAKQMGESVV